LTFKRTEELMVQRAVCPHGLIKALPKTFFPRFVILNCGTEKRKWQPYLHREAEVAAIFALVTVLKTF
jgi:hypothetical protein